MSDQQQASSEPTATERAATTPDAEAVKVPLSGAGKPSAASAPEGAGAGRTAVTGAETGADPGEGTLPTSSTVGRDAGAAATGRTGTADDTEEASPGEKPQGTDSAEATAAQAASGDVDAGEGEKDAAAGTEGVGANKANGAQGLSAAAVKGQRRTVATAVDDGGATGSSRSGAGRPRKPVLAAAAVVGALLIAVPLLITANDRNEEETVADTAGSDTVLDTVKDPVGVFATQSPSPAQTEREEKDAKRKASATPTADKPAVSAAPAAPAAPAAESSPSPSRRTKAVVKKAPSNLPHVLTRVLIKNNTNRTCVDVPGFTSGRPDGPVTHATCNSNTDDNQLWNVEKRYDKAGPGGVPLFQIRNVMDSMCLDLPGYQGVGGATKVTEFPCNGTTNDNQLWWLDKQSDGTFWIRNAASNNQCLDSYGPDDQTRDLIVWPCAPEGQNNHEWIFTRS
ncbi:ricin-type beta-trefoil lectin domain protein [Streptomyces sp. NPDC048737]|uniref:ricin-type beta-trefoil lectin domain protein n=1 Tax=unclassified Streptomyces TaxID=2593676 RepID=UPI0034435BF6